MTRTDISTSSVVASLQERFVRRQASSDVNERYGAYVLAAAVLDVMDPTRLRPYGDVSDVVGGFADLFDKSVPAVGWRKLGLRSIRPDVRLAALRQLGSRSEMRRALQANSEREQTGVQQFFERWMTGGTIAPATLNYADLECLRQLYEWGIDAFGGLPPRREFEAARVRRSAVAIFEHLVDANFVGREKELQLLRDHVGVVSPSIWARARAFLSSGRAPLLVWGPGGSGKTALIGRFLMEHLDAALGAWFPFAYLPFDSQSLDVREPFTLLAAAATQLHTQVANSDDPVAPADVRVTFDKFTADVARYRDQRKKLGQRAIALGSQSARLGELSSEDQSLYFSFARLLRRIAMEAGRQQEAKDVPVVLVLDTFEEVLYRAQEDLEGVAQMLDTIGREFRGLRVVIAGRSRPSEANVAGLKISAHELSDLNDVDAGHLLKGLGVAEEQTARAIVRQVGGNPLTLRLAARVAKEEQARDGIAGLKTRKYFFLDIGGELIRGQLYRRLLDHIHDPDVRALAHPGMVLRRVTADIIVKILAPVCDLENVDDERATELFEELRREHTLVRLEDDSSLRYRQEVRQPILALLTRDKPLQVKMLHERTVEYYASSGDVADRAEEIYHRLMLREEFDGRWLPGVERYLASAIEEIPPQQRVELASHMSLHLPEETYAMADTARWEALVGRRALEILRHRGPAEVLKLLSARGSRTPESPLFAIEARCLMALNEWWSAAQVIDGAVAQYPPIGNAGRLAELWWLRAEVSRAMNEITDAVGFLERLCRLAPALTSPLPLVQALTELVEVNESRQAGNVDERAALAEALGRLSEAEVDSERSLVRLALVRLGRNFPNMVRRLAPQVAGDFVDFASDWDDARWSSLIKSVAHDLSDAPTSLGSLVRRLQEGPSSEGVRRLIYGILDAIKAGNADHRLTDVLLTFFEVERSTLASATLAGLDDYRESWEREVAAETAR